MTSGTGLEESNKGIAVAAIVAALAAVVYGREPAEEVGCRPAFSLTPDQEHLLEPYLVAPR